MTLKKNSRSRNRTVALLASTLLAASSMSATFGVAGAQEGSLYESAEQANQGSVEASSQGSAVGSASGLVPGSIDLNQGDFYSTLPETVEGEPGEILKKEPSNFALGVPLVDWTGSTATRVAYVSTDDKGQTVPITGTVLTPTSPWKGKGPRPLMAIAPGTQGSGDACAPSKLMPYGVEYEALPIAAALARGWNVAITDLHGLGTSAQHTYMNRVLQGNATLDVARAAENLEIPGIDSNTPVATFGYSQGGGSSAAALELQPTYAPELNLVTGYAGGVPADLHSVAKKVDKSPLTGVLGYTVNGFLNTEPQLQPLMDELLNEKGKLLLEQTKDECLPQSIANHAFVDTSTLTKDGRALWEILQDEPLKSLVDRQLIGERAPTVPVYVGHGTNDDSIPVEQSRRMARMWCEAGTPVNYQEQNIPMGPPLTNHVFPMLTNLTPAMAWMEKVINGENYETTPCGQIPSDVDVKPTGLEAAGSTPGSVAANTETIIAGVPGSLSSSTGSSRP
ncbi:lipase family protein [Corynebacterium dentalis]|uniref:lipase family protein n=1 Tax=Corynebacterium dentalis TaxID=2014528 RepID=UPI002897C3DE|nr:lipase family protein [Corynebacterium dentalis]